MFSFIYHTVLLLLLFSSHGDKFRPPWVPELLHDLLGSPWCGVYDSTPCFSHVLEQCNSQEMNRTEGSERRRLFQGLLTYYGLTPLYWLFQFLWYLIRNLRYCFPETPGSWDTGLDEKPVWVFRIYVRVVCLLVETESLVRREKLKKCQPIRF